MKVIINVIGDTQPWAEDADHGKYTHNSLHYTHRVYPQKANILDPWLKTLN